MVPAEVRVAAAGYRATESHLFSKLSANRGWGLSTHIVLFTSVTDSTFHDHLQFGR